MEQTKSETTEVKLDLSSEPNLLEQTKVVVAELKAQNDRKEALLVREERDKANALLGGRSDAGQVIKTPAELEKEKSQQLADEITHAFRR